MTSKKQKERKKKNREKIAKNRVLKRRESLRRQRKQAMQERINEVQAEEKVFGKQKPFVKNDASVLNEAVSELKKQHVEDINAKLEHNLKILEALEEEYDRENATRKEINQKLENEGHMTMKEKMDALHKKALELEGIAGDMEKAQKEFDENKDEIVVDAEPLVIENNQISTNAEKNIEQNPE